MVYIPELKRIIIGGMMYIDWDPDTMLKDTLSIDASILSRLESLESRIQALEEA